MSWRECSGRSADDWVSTRNRILSMWDLVSRLRTVVSTRTRGLVACFYVKRKRCVPITATRRPNDEIPADVIVR